MIYGVVLVSGVQDSESVIQIHISAFLFFFEILSPTHGNFKVSSNHSEKETEGRIRVHFTSSNASLLLFQYA